VAPLPRDGALIATLEQGPRVVASDAGALDPFERAVLETLDVPLVLPIWGRQRLAGLLALGPKRSGDVFTSTERALLVSVADKIAGELQRFDQAERLAASDRLQTTLRQYVEPGIADRLGRGEAIEIGEREVSVLFSDLRDYTAWAQGRPLAELHATVNRYAEIVARIVREHAGTVVDFAGDGMMAVFGAPDEIPGKEHAAVAAARRIVETVRQLAVLSPGVGVATGPAWLGTVRAGGQLHWSALGDTTNLASRLQALTRELDAWIVLDERTWRRAGEEAAAFEACGATAIRGRAETEPLWMLPIRQPGVRASRPGGRE
jgi:class 3 adenylate cyclase